MTTPDARTVAVIGTGRMGAAMVARLRGAGANVVIFNRTRGTAQKVAAETGATVADTAREAAGAAAVVLVSLADDRALEDMYGGPDGIIAGVVGGTVVADTSTVDPRTIQRLAGLLHTRGASLLDAPVSGSLALVGSGELTILAGGAADDLERVRPVLDILSRRIIHVGQSGAGSTMKLAVNAIVHAINQALSEALVLAESAGVERDVAYDVFAASAAAAPFVLYKRAAFEHPDDTPVAFSLDLVAKDLDLALLLASRTGAPMAQTEANRRAVATAIDAGYGSSDLSALARMLREQARTGSAPGL